MLPDVDALPPSLTSEQAAPLLGVSRGCLWAAARDEGGFMAGSALIEPIRVGRALRWPKAPIVRALGLDQPVPHGHSNGDAEQGEQGDHPIADQADGVQEPVR